MKYSFQGLNFPDIKASIKGRIHTKAQSLPGNSGGAVVDDNGDLIGFLASGDGNFNEVIPIRIKMPFSK